MNGADSPQPWPPREGWTFFMLWMAGAVVIGVINHVAALFSSPRPFGQVTAASAIPLLIGLAASGWQGWLIFRRGWRWAGWIAITVIVHGIYLALTSMMMARIATPELSSVLPWFNAVAFVFPVLETILLVGVRRRPWGWLVVGAAAVLVGRQIELLAPLPITRSIFDWVVAHVPLLKITDLYTAFSAGVALLVATIPACALAFWMPPIVRADSTMSPSISAVGDA